MMTKNSRIRPILVPAIAALVFVFLVTGCSSDSSERMKAASEIYLTAVNQVEQGNYAEALVSARQALYAQRMIESDSLCAESALLLGHIYRQLSELDSSEQSFRMGIDYAEAASDRRLRVRNAVAYAVLLADLGRNDEAIALAAESLPLARFSTDTVSIFRALNVLMRANRENGSFADAMQYLGQLIQLDSAAFRQQGEVELRTEELRLLGVLKPVEEVRTTYKRLALRFAGRNDQLAVAELQGAWAEVQMSYGQRDSAYRTFTQVLSSSALDDDPSLKKAVLIQLGTFQYRRRNFEEARRFYLEALKLMGGEREAPGRYLIGLQLVACRWKVAMSRNTRVSGELPAACTVLRDSATASGFRPGVVFGTFLLARLQLAAGDTMSAWHRYLEAREALLLNGLSFFPPHLNELLRAFVDGEGGTWFRAPLELACRSANVDTAFILDEEEAQAEVSGFFQVLPLRCANIDLETRIKAQQAARQKLTLFERDLAVSSSVLNLPRAEYLTRRENIEVVRREDLRKSAMSVSAIGPSFGFLTRSTVPAMAEIRDALPTHGALLKYVDAGDAIYAIVVRRDSVTMHRLPGSRESILSFAQDYLAMLSGSGADETGILKPRADARRRIDDLSQLLYSLLIGPVEDELRLMDAVFLRVPPSFGWLPIHTLSRSGSGGRAMLAQKFKISYLPVASALLFPAVPERAPLQVVGFGYRGTSLWDVEYELADIRSFYEKAPMLFDSMATFEKLQQRRADILAIAGVFTIDRTNPSRSGILTSAGRSSYTYRVTPLGHLSEIPVPQTVVVSDVSGAAGVLWSNVPLLMLANGTRTVIATMWRGDRKAKKYFGEMFYTASFNGSTAADAYQRAIIAVATSREFAGAERWGLYYRFGK